MNLLFDANVSFRILELLKSHFSSAAHASQHNLNSATDINIWNFAQKNNFCIVTKDSDFNDLAIARRAPPKIIWLKVGNLKTGLLAEFILSHASKINLFLKDDHSAVLILS